MMKAEAKTLLIGLSGSVFIGGLSVTGLYYAFNIKMINLTECEVDAIEYDVPDSQAAQSLEKKLTEQFGQSGFTFEVRAPEPEQSSAKKTKSPSAAPQ